MRSGSQVKTATRTLRVRTIRQLEGDIAGDLRDESGHTKGYNRRLGGVEKQRCDYSVARVLEMQKLRT